MIATQLAERVASRLRFACECPCCRRPMGEADLLDLSARAVCRNCGFALVSFDGVWRALAPDREAYFRDFVRDYSAIRHSEGRGSPSPAFYLALPYRDLTGRNQWQWNIRAKSFDCFSERVLPGIERRLGSALRILDIGAGNGWLSFRLSRRGHTCLAVDLVDDHFDGIGALRHYRPHTAYPPCALQAEMDRLPFAAQQFDIAIFNASFHYSEDFARTVSEAARCLRPGGEIVILDSPWYSSDVSGNAMIEEKHAVFAKQYGTASRHTRAMEFLTRERLARIERACGLRWHSAEPWYGWRWAMRPFAARLRGRREPSQFRLFWATVGEQ